MGRILITLILIMSVSCKKERPVDAKDQAINNIIMTILHHDSPILGDMRDYIEINHLSDACANDLMIKIVELYDFLDSTQTFIVNKSGGFDVNGHLINRYDEDNFKKILKDIEFKAKLNAMVASINNIDTHYSELISESIKEDVRPFSFNSYEKTTLANVFIDFVIVKSNLINTEVKYFEMLKSNIDCNNDTQI